MHVHVPLSFYSLAYVIFGSLVQITSSLHNDRSLMTMYSLVLTHRQELISFNEMDVISRSRRIKNGEQIIWSVVISEKDSEKPSSVVMSRTKSAEV